MKTKATIVTALLINSLSGWLPTTYDAWYFKLQAVSILVLCLAGRFGDKKETTTIAWDWAIMLCLNNLYDELFGNPIVCGWVEVSAATIITLWTLYRIKKCTNQTSK